MGVLTRHSTIRDKKIRQKQPMLKLVIFDCDGVMFDSREANRVYYDRLLSGFSCPPMEEDEVNFVHVHSVNDSVAHIFRHHPLVEMEDVNRYRAGLDYAEFIPWMQEEPDLKEFLKWLKPDYHTAISTNRTTTMPLVMEMFSLNPWFDKVVTAMDTKKPKPDPEALHIILNHFQLKPRETIFIGDSYVDRQHCQPLAIPLIAFKNRNLDADYHVKSFMEIPELAPFKP